MGSIGASRGELVDRTSGTTEPSSLLLGQAISNANKGTEVKTVAGSDLPNELSKLRKGDSIEVSVARTNRAERFTIIDSNTVSYRGVDSFRAETLTMEEAQKKIQNSLDSNTVRIRRK